MESTNDYKDDYHKIISYTKVKDQYHVIFNVIALNLSLENSNVLSESLSGPYCLHAKAYINSTKNEVGTLTIQFSDEHSAQTLIKILYPIIQALRDKETNNLSFYSRQKKSIYYNQIVEIYRVHLDYVRIALGSNDRNTMQSVIKAHIEKNTEFFVPNSLIMKNNCILALDFTNETAAINLIRDLFCTRSNIKQDSVYFNQWLSQFIAADSSSRPSAP